MSPLKRFRHCSVEIINGLADQVPDATTVWLFHEQLIEQQLIEPLFEQFDGYLIEQGYAAQRGQIVDAILIPVPKQHKGKDKTEQIKQGEVPSDWQDKPHKRSQKDTEARWKKKGGKSYFGYKNHNYKDMESRELESLTSAVRSQRSTN